MGCAVSSTQGQPEPSFGVAPGTPHAEGAGTLAPAVSESNSSAVVPATPHSHLHQRPVQIRTKKPVSSPLRAQRKVDGALFMSSFPTAATTPTGAVAAAADYVPVAAVDNDEDEGGNEGIAEIDHPVTFNNAAFIAMEGSRIEEHRSPSGTATTPHPASLSRTMAFASA